MKKTLRLSLILLLVFCCKEREGETKESKHEVVFDKVLADELRKMAEVDQIAAYIPQGEYEKMSSVQWKAFKDSVFTSHQKRLQKLFDEHGFLGFNKVGEEGSRHFWLMVQHSHHDPEFQAAVLEKMEIAVAEQNADPGSYGLLVDRVRLNTGRDQVYGTQVDYDHTLARAYVKNLMDSATVNQRRKAIGLDPLEVYLNDMSKAHFEMNKAFYAQKGITVPTLYPIDLEDL